MKVKHQFNENQPFLADSFVICQAMRKTATHLLIFKILKHDLFMTKGGIDIVANVKEKERNVR